MTPTPLYGTPAWRAWTIFGSQPLGDSILKGDAMTPTQRQHTKTPWVIKHHAAEPKIEPENPTYVINDGWIISQCFGPDGIANARHVVRCVNSHEQLVEALEIALGQCRSFSMSKNNENCIKIIEQALKEATCQTPEIS